MSPAAISELNKTAYVHIEDWRNRPLQGGKYPYVYVDGIYLRRNWGGEYRNLTEINILYTLGATIGRYLTFVVVNWAVTTLMDGKGKRGRYSAPRPMR